MSDYSEDKIKDWLSLYDDDIFSLPSVEDAFGDFDYYVSDESDVTPLGAVDAFRPVENACLSHFGYWILQAKEVRAASLDIAQRVRFLRDNARVLSFESNPNHLTPSLANYGETLLQLLATSRLELVTPTEQLALRVLKSGRYKAPDGAGGYFSAPARVGVFALEMLAAARGEAIEWETFHVPPDRFWLDCARVGLTEPDPTKAAEWARELCDAHMRTLRSDLENGALNAAPGQEIEEAAHFLWPISTVAFLRMRARLGLSTAEVDHPLMRTSFAVLHDWAIPGDAWPGAPWYADVLAKIDDAAPELSPSLAPIR